MNTAYFDFDATTVGALPAGIVSADMVVGTTDPISGAHSLGGGGTTSIALYTGDSPAADMAVQHTQTFRTGATTGSGLVARMSADGLNGYVVGWFWSNAYFLVKFIAGAPTILDTQTLSIVPVDGDVVKSKLEVEGTTVRWRMWLASDPEPGTWFSEVADSSITDPGYGGTRGAVAIDNLFIGDPDTTFVPPGSPLAMGAASNTAASDSTVTVHVSHASGGVDPKTYQWFRNPTPGTIGAPVSSATDITLVDTGLTNEVTLYYTCVATDAHGTTAASTQVAATPRVNSPFTAQLTPYRELLYSRYRNVDLSPAAITAVADGATLTVDGVVRDLEAAAFSPLGWVAWTTCKVKSVATIDNEAVSGYAKTGTWAAYVNSPALVIAGTSMAGDSFDSSVDPTADATWGPYAGLHAGTYRVCPQFFDFPGPDRSPDALYTVKDGGGNVLDVKHFDMTQPIGTDSPITYGGRYYQDLGTVYLPVDGSIAITLSNGGAAGTKIIADEMLLRGETDPPPAGSTVTFSAPEGTVTTIAGALPAVVDRPVTFLDVPTFLPCDLTRMRTLAAGWNKSVSGGDSISMGFADRATFLDPWERADGGSSVTTGSDGEIVSLTGSARKAIITYFPNAADNVRGVGVLPSGSTFDLEFDWPAGNGVFDLTAQDGQTITFESFTGHTYTKNGYTDLGGGRWRLNITITWSQWVPIEDRAAGSGLPYRPTWTDTARFNINAIVRRFSLYDSRTTDHAAAAHPDIVERLGGRKFIQRLMDILGTNASTVIDYADFGRVSTTNRDAMAEADLIAIHPVPTDDGDALGILRYFPAGDQQAIVLLELSSTAGFAPTGGLGTHLSINLAPGQTSLFAASQGGTLTGLQFTLDGLCSATINGTLIAAQCSYGGLAAGAGDPTAFPVTVDQSYTIAAGSKVARDARRTIPGDVFRMVAACPQNLLYANIPTLASDACTDEFADTAFAATQPGDKVYFELGNETWNNGFRQWHWLNASFVFANWQHAQDPVAFPHTFANGREYYGYLADSRRRRVMARAALQPVDRSGDVVWALGGWTANPGQGVGPPTGWGATQTPPVATDFGVMVFENYWDMSARAGLGYSPAGADGFFDRLGPAGTVEFFALCVLYGGYLEQVSVSRGILGDNGFGTKPFGVYEGGTQFIGSGGGTVDTGGRWAQELSRHPLQYPLRLAALDQLDRAGFIIFLRYAYDYSGGVNGVAAWCDEPVPTMQPGTGDPAENGRPWKFDELVSQGLGAMQAWAAPQSTTPTTPRWKRAIAIWHRGRRRGRRR